MKIITALLISFTGISAFASCHHGIEISMASYSQLESCNGAGHKYVSYERYLCQNFDHSYHYEYKKVSETICQ